MTIASYTEALETIQAGTFIRAEVNFALAQFCAMGLRLENTYAARDVIIRLLDRWKEVPAEFRPLWNDLVESAGLYPYVEPELLTGASRMRLEAHKSRYLRDVYMHEEQQEISAQLLANNSAIVSAPTSFGKSLLIEEIIAAKRYNNIVVIQPTLALLDETRKKLQKYAQEYQIILSTEQKPIQDRRHLWLFTAERVIEYDGFHSVDFFIIDEFYKLSMERDDERAISLNQALYKLLKQTQKFYFLGPSIKSIPVNVERKLSFVWFHSKFATVALDESRISKKKFRNETEKRPVLFELLSLQKEPTLIYCSSPERATDLALAFAAEQKVRPAQNIAARITQIVEWIRENIHTDWSLVDAIESGVGFHHGALPRHLSSSIVDLFNEGAIRFLFCTSTLIEGVNTSAKNVVLYDKRKGKKPIDYFDYRNISGRSGRMNKHFIGRVYRFDEAPDELDLEVDIPVLTQESAPIELLIHIDPIELTATSTERLSDFQKLDPLLQDIIRNNGNVSVQGQLAIIREIEDNLAMLHAKLAWKGYTTSYEDLFAVIDLGWRHLLSRNETKGGVVSAKQLAFFTSRYVTAKSLKRLIDETVREPYWIQEEPVLKRRVDRITFLILNVARHWFDYKLPKYLRAISELQKYVFEKHNLPPGNYIPIASQLENFFLPSLLKVLCEYDIPLSAARKIGRFLPPNFDPNNVILALKRVNWSSIQLLDYERLKILELLGDSA